MPAPCKRSALKPSMVSSSYENRSNEERTPRRQGTKCRGRVSPCPTEIARRIRRADAPTRSTRSDEWIDPLHERCGCVGRRRRGIVLNGVERIAFDVVAVDTDDVRRRRRWRRRAREHDRAWENCAKPHASSLRDLTFPCEGACRCRREFQSRPTRAPSATASASTNRPRR